MREADLRPYIDRIDRAMARYMDGWKPMGFIPEDHVPEAFARHKPCTIPTPTFGGTLTASYTEFDGTNGRNILVAEDLFSRYGIYLDITHPRNGSQSGWLKDEDLPRFAAALFEHSGKIVVEEVAGYDGPEYTTSHEDVDQVWVISDDDAEVELHNAVIRLHAVTEYRKRKAADAAKEAEAKKAAEEAAAKAEAVAKEFPVGSLVTVAADADDVYFKKGEGPFVVRNTNSAEAHQARYEREGRILVQDGDDGMDQWVRPQDLTKIDEPEEEDVNNVPYFNISVSVSGDIDPGKIAEQIMYELRNRPSLR